MAGKKLVLIDLGGMAQGTREACSKTWDTASSLALENTRWNDADFFFFLKCREVLSPALKNWLVQN